MKKGIKNIHYVIGAVIIGATAYIYFQHKKQADLEAQLLLNKVKGADDNSSFSNATGTTAPAAKYYSVPPTLDGSPIPLNLYIGDRGLASGYALGYNEAYKKCHKHKNK